MQASEVANAGTFDIATVLASLIAAAISGVIVAILNNKYNNKTREASMLRIQLEKLYGPLKYYTAQNQISLEMNNKLSDASNKEYYDNEITKDKIDDEAVMKIRIEYIDKAIATNELIIKLLEQGFAYADADDMTMFAKFAEDYMRHRTEFDKNGQLRYSKQVYENTDEVVFIRSEFIKRVDEKFLSKQQRLRKLGG